MNRVYVFLIQNDVWIYILCGLGIFWYASEFIRARRSLRRAVFGLERERARRIQQNAFTLLTILVLIVGAVAYVNIQVRPTLPAELLVPPTPTPNVFRTPLASPTPLRDLFNEPESTPTAPIAPTVTLRPDGVPVPSPGTPSPTPEVTATPENAPPTTVVGGSSCPPGITIATPADGSTVFGSVAFLGTANVENLAFYKLEINGPETSNQWASLLGQVIVQPVVNGLLGTGNFNGWQNGVYTVRLTVVDATSNDVGECRIQINIQNQ